MLDYAGVLASRLAPVADFTIDAFAVPAGLEPAALTLKGWEYSALTFEIVRPLCALIILEQLKKCLVSDLRLSN